MIAPADLERALTVLGPALENWRAAIVRSFPPTVNAEDFYHPEVDGPVLAAGRVWVGSRGLGSLIDALGELEHSQIGMDLIRVVVALQPVRTAMTWLVSDARRQPSQRPA